MHTGVLPRFLATCLAAATVAAGAAWVSPAFVDGTFARDGGEPQTFVFPLEFSSGDAEEFVTAAFTMRHRRFGPARIHVLPDDCVEGITVNGVPLQDSSLPFCDYSAGRVIDLSGALHPGDNAVTVRVRNAGGDGGLRVRAAARDPVVLGFALLFALLVATGIWLCARMTGAGDRWMVAILIIGILLRAGYAAQTPWTVRGHDTDGHIQYIEYVAEHWSLPPPHEGWQYYQPPLYYMLAGGIFAAGSMAGFDRHAVLTALQWVAALLSILTLLAGMRMGTLLFASASQQWARRAFALLLAVLPGLILPAARINNDVLVQFLMVCALLAGVRYAVKPSRQHLLNAAVLTGLAMLAKSNALLLVPIILLCVIASRRTFRQHVVASATAIAVIAAVVGWLPAVRYGFQGQEQAVVGNIGNLNSGLKLDTSWKTFVVFSPPAMLSAPFNDPWSDDARRQEFWEYFYRSAYFGEFRFADDLKPLAQATLLTSFLLIPLGILGLRPSSKTNRRITGIMLGALAVLLAGHVAFRISFPFSSSQDFRYLTLAALPAAYFVARGLTLRWRPVRWAGATAVAAHALLCAAFVIGILTT